MDDAWDDMMKPEDVFVYGKKPDDVPWDARPASWAVDVQSVAEYSAVDLHKFVAGEFGTRKQFADWTKKSEDFVNGEHANGEPSHVPQSLTPMCSVHRRTGYLDFTVWDDESKTYYIGEPPGFETSLYKLRYGDWLRASESYVPKHEPLFCTLNAGLESLASNMDISPIAASERSTTFFSKKSVPWSKSINAFAIHGPASGKLPKEKPQGQPRAPKRTTTEGRRLKVPSKETDEAWKGVWQGFFAVDAEMPSWEEFSSMAVAWHQQFKSNEWPTKYSVAPFRRALKEKYNGRELSTEISDWLATYPARECRVLCPVLRVPCSGIRGPCSVFRVLCSVSCVPCSLADRFCLVLMQADQERSSRNRRRNLALQVAQKQMRNVGPRRSVSDRRIRIPKRRRTTRWRPTAMF